jgi:hypothetical protein
VKDEPDDDEEEGENEGTKKEEKDGDLKGLDDIKEESPKPSEKEASSSVNEGASTSSNMVTSNENATSTSLPSVDKIDNPYLRAPKKMKYEHSYK